MPESKRRRRAPAQPAHEPAPAHEPSPRAHEFCEDDEYRALANVAARNGISAPTTSEEADMFLTAIMGIRLWRSDGVGRGETKGEIVGYNSLSGTNYGGADDPLPPGARAAFMLAENGWQTVSTTTGKRSRS